MANEQQVFEYRGVDNLYIAEVTQDDKTAYVTGTPIYLAPVAEVSKSTDSSSEAHYYDNKAMIVVNSESADTITITIAPPVLEKLAMVTGKSFDAETGMMVDSPRQNKYFALMYRTKGTDGKYRYVSRLKGQFNIPDETSATEDDGTDANNVEIEYTGIYTEFEFTKGMFDGSNWSKAGAKGIVVDTRYGLADVTNFFDAVQTPDSIHETGYVAVTAVALNKSTTTIEEGSTETLVATITPANATNQNVNWSSSDTTKATVGNEGTVTAVAAGTAIITATTVDGGKTASCTVTVQQAG